METYLSETDDQFWAQHPIKPDRPETWKDYAISRYIAHGDMLDFGDKRISVYATPGHTPGGLSYFFPVTENGVRHTAALWGGTTPPRSVRGITQYMRSLDSFQQEAARLGADVALSNHTAVDCGSERIAYSRARLAYLPNAYIIGPDGVRRFLQVFRTLSYEMLEQLE